MFLASNILREIFSKCEEYVKIQDPYIDEETFHVMQYVPPENRIELLTGIKIRVERASLTAHCLMPFSTSSICT